eukprot:scaffold6655_cov169-Amphora_coffeaeformis.AAC.34
MANGAGPYSFRKLTVVESFSRLVAIYLDSAYTRLFIKLACLMVIPCTFIGMIIINYVLAGVAAEDDNITDPVSWKNWAAILLIAVSKIFFHNCAAILSDAAIVYTVAELYMGNTRPAWTTSLNVALRNVHQLFLVGFIIFVGIVVGYACLGVGGIYVAVVSSLVTPVIMVEGKTAVEALQRSVQLTQGFRWHIVTCLAIIFILNYLVSHLLNMLFSGGTLGMWFSVYGSLVNMLPASIFVPAVAILKTVIYLSIRGEKEGLDADGLASEMGHRSLLSPSEIFEYQELSMADGTPMPGDESEQAGPL